MGIAQQCDEFHPQGHETHSPVPIPDQRQEDSALLSRPSPPHRPALGAPSNSSAATSVLPTLLKSSFGILCPLCPLLVIPVPAGHEPSQPFKIYSTRNFWPSESPRPTLRFFSFRSCRPHFAEVQFWPCAPALPTPCSCCRSLTRPPQDVAARGRNIKRTTARPDQVTLEALLLSHRPISISFVAGCMTSMN